MLNASGIGLFSVMTGALHFAMPARSCSTLLLVMKLLHQVSRILDIVPEHIHDRCPIIMGSPRDTDKVLSLYA